MHLPRLVPGISFAAALLVAGASAPTDAFAHGGVFRGPGGQVPPGLRPPSDPPPPSPQPDPPPTVRPPDSTPPPAGPGGTPPQTGPTPPAPGTGEGGGHERRSAAIGYENWTFWWGHAKDDVLHVKEAIYRLRFTPDNPLGVIGSRGGNTHDATRATEKHVKDVLIPALRWAMDPKNRLDSDAESAAYLGLAKVTNDPADIRAIQRGVTDETRHQIVRESAALALGLLRRGEGREAFDARELDRVRDFLFETFEDDGLPTRVRAFAMLAVGILGDQATARGSTATGIASDLTAATRSTAGRVFDLLRERYRDDNLPVSLLVALSLQPTDAVTPEMTDVLKECALKGRLFRDEANELLQSYAALALGRVGTDLHVDSMLNVMTQRTKGHQVTRSAAIALGELGRRVDGERRAEVASGLVRAVESARDASTKSFGLMSLACLLRADVEAQRTDVLNAKGVRVADYLVQVAESGGAVQRPFGALALGLVGRAIGPRAEIEAYGKLRERAVAVLRAGLDDPSMDKRTRAGFAIGLGMLRDAGSRERLTAFVSDPREDVELRGYSCVALGMIGESTRDVVGALEKALEERSSEELRQQAAVALGLLGNPNAVPLLLRALEESETQAAKGEVILALAQVGDARAIEPLVTLLKDDSQPDATRAFACAGLGLIGDLEPVRSLTRLSKDVNYRAGPGSITEVLTIL